MKHINRMLALIVTIAMLINIVPLQAFADPTGSGEGSMPPIITIIDFDESQNCTVTIPDDGIYSYIIEGGKSENTVNQAVCMWTDGSLYYFAFCSANGNNQEINDLKNNEGIDVYSTTGTLTIKVGNTTLDNLNGKSPKEYTGKKKTEDWKIISMTSDTLGKVFGIPKQGENGQFVLTAAAGGFDIGSFSVDAKLFDELRKYIGQIRYTFIGDVPPEDKRPELPKNKDNLSIKAGDTVRPEVTSYNSVETDDAVYHFKGWEPEQYTFAGNKDESVLFEGRWEKVLKAKIQYQPDDAEKGSVSLANELILPDATSTPAGSTATPKEGYQFVNWTVNGQVVSTDATLTGNVVATYAKQNNKYVNTTFVAHFAKNSVGYTVNYCWVGDQQNPLKSESGSGTIGESFNANENQTFDGYTIVPNQTFTKEITANSNDNVLTILYYQLVTLTANNDSDVYNGNEQTSDNGYSCSVPGLTFENITASATGKSADTYTIKFNEDPVGKKDTTGNYEVEKAEEGEYTITRAEYWIVTESNSKTYDGMPLTAGASVQGLKGFEKATVSATGSQKNANTTSPTINTYGEINWDTASENNYVHNTDMDQYGTLVVYPAPLTIVTDSASRVYNGKALTAGGSCSGLVGEETVDFELTGTQTKVGNSKNSYTLEFNGTAQKDNYVIGEDIGTLTVTEYADEIIIRTVGGSKIYDGTPLDGTIDAPELPEGYYYDTLRTDATVTHVAEGTVEVHVEGLNIKNADGEDVTGNLNITLDESAVIKINPAPLTIKTESASKLYDGKPLTAPGTISGFVKDETATFTVTGSQTQYGTSDNTYTLVFDGTTAEETDYKVIEDIGKLTVNKEAMIITVTGEKTITTYDGQTHFADIDSISSENPLFDPSKVSYTKKPLSGKDVMAQTAIGYTADDFKYADDNFDVTFVVNDGYLEISPRPLTVTANDKEKTYGDADPVLNATVEGLATGDYIVPILSRAAGENAGKYSIFVNVPAQKNYTVETKNGTLTILRRPVTVTADDQFKTYRDPDPELTAKIKGLIPGDSESLIDYKIGRESGEGSGEYLIRVRGDEVQGNYDVSYVPGKMKIVAIGSVIVKITGKNVDELYDGTEFDASGYTVEINDPLYTENDFRFNGGSELKGTNAGTYTLDFSADDFENINPNFSRVYFQTGSSKLVIRKRNVTMTSGNAEAPYTGAVLTNSTVTVSGDGFAANEGATPSVTGSIREVGTVENTFTYALNNGTLAGNYNITTVFGTLKITDALKYKVIIHYQDEDGNDIGTFEKEYATGEQYDITPENIPGFKPDTDRVTGRMGTEDVTVTVTYDKVPYTLTVKFVNTNGDALADPVVAVLYAGDAYNVPVPTFDGYTADTVLVDGAMPAEDKTVTVLYQPVAAPAPNGPNYLDFDEYEAALGIADSVLGGGMTFE